MGWSQIEPGLRVQISATARSKITAPKFRLTHPNSSEHLRCAGNLAIRENTEIEKVTFLQVHLQVSSVVFCISPCYHLSLCISSLDIGDQRAYYDPLILLSCWLHFRPTCDLAGHRLTNLRLSKGKGKAVPTQA